MYFLVPLVAVLLCACADGGRHDKSTEGERALEEFAKDVDEEEGIGTFSVIGRRGATDPCVQGDRLGNCWKYKKYCSVSNVVKYCPVTCSKCKDRDGGYTPWFSWSACSTSCGNGIMTRKRTCTNPTPRGGGAVCSWLGASTQSKTCISPPCAVDRDGGYTPWFSWSACSTSCGDGIMTRKRTCTNPTPRGGGADCSWLGGSTQTTKCTSPGCTEICEEVDHVQCPYLSEDDCKNHNDRGSWAKLHCRKTCKLCTEESVTCGNAPIRNKADNSDDIVDGKEASQGYYPWQVAIYIDDVFLCGGSLISKKYVLSAAHCFKGSEDEPETFKIVLGDHDRTNNIGVEQTVYVKKIIIHGSYERQSTINDIALVELQDEAKLSDFIQIICLPDAGEIRRENEYCQVTGWGKFYAGGDEAKRLQEITVPIVNQAKCKQINDKPDRSVTEQMICTGFYDGYTFKSACHGDSGGPLSCKIDTKWKLFGIVSWGAPTCNALENYNVFTKVSAFIPWIKENQK